MKVDRRAFLNCLQCIAPGISKQEVVLQSSCVVFMNGWAYSLSEEIACATKSGLPKDLNCAVKVEKLISLLRLLQDEVLDIDFDSSHLHLNAGGKRRLKEALEAEIMLPVADVELSEGWQELHEDFAEAVTLSGKCAKKKDEKNFAFECIHVHPEWVEASDNTRVLRYRLPTFVRQSVLVRARVLHEMTQLGMTKAAETENWLHFRNALPLRVSVKKYALESYPDMTRVLNKRGTTVKFPGGMRDAAVRAGLYAPESVRVKVTPQGMLVSGGSGKSSLYEEDVDMKYRGKDLIFSVQSKLVADVVKHDSCEVTDCSIRVDGGKYVFCAELEVG